MVAPISDSSPRQSVSLGRHLFQKGSSDNEVCLADLCFPLSVLQYFSLKLFRFSFSQYFFFRIFMFQFSTYSFSVSVIPLIHKNEGRLFRERNREIIGNKIGRKSRRVSGLNINAPAFLGLRSLVRVQLKALKSFTCRNKARGSSWTGKGKHPCVVPTDQGKDH